MKLGKRENKRPESPEPSGPGKRKHKHSSSDISTDDLINSISSGSRKHTTRYCNLNCAIKFWPLAAGNMKIRKRMTHSYTEMREGRIRAFWIPLEYLLQPSRSVFNLTEVVSATRTVCTLYLSHITANSLQTWRCHQSAFASSLIAKINLLAPCSSPSYISILRG